jgi:hypothetical protein
MTTNTVEQRLRTFLLVTTAGICVFTVAELWLTEHMESAIQLIPFVLCGVGLIAVLAALFRPRRGTLWTLRLVMALLIAGSLFGIWEHLEGNIGFALEIRPTATTSEVLVEALKGANPLLAPGILGLAGMLALAATYAHPALAKRRSTPAAHSGQHSVALGERGIK